MGVDMKQCNTCNTFFELDQYRIRKLNGKEYIGHKCKNCERREQKEKTSDSWDRYFIRLLSKRERHLTLSVEECVIILKKQNYLCAVTGVPLTKIHGSGVINTNASLDRIIAGGPYEPWNIRIVCSIVNKMRLDNSDSEFKWWCRKIIDGIDLRSN